MTETHARRWSSRTHALARWRVSSLRLPLLPRLPLRSMFASSCVVRLTSPCAVSPIHVYRHGQLLEVDSRAEVRPHYGRRGSGVPGTELRSGRRGGRADCSMGKGGRGSYVDGEGRRGFSIEKRELARWEGEPVLGTKQRSRREEVAGSMGEKLLASTREKGRVWPWQRPIRDERRPWVWSCWCLT